MGTDLKETVTTELFCKPLRGRARILLVSDTGFESHHRTDSRYSASAPRSSSISPSPNSAPSRWAQTPSAQSLPKPPASSPDAPPTYGSKRAKPCSSIHNPLSPHLRSLQRRPQAPHAESKFLAVRPKFYDHNSAIAYDINSARNT
jgi:hypothetical protein